MRWWVLSVVFLGACTHADTDSDGSGDADADADSDADSDADTDADSDADTDADTDTSPSADEDAVRGLIAGTGDLGTVMHDVAWSGGWPVRTDSGTFLFVHPTDQGGSWLVAGSFSAWEGYPMAAGDGFVWAEVAIADPAGATYKLVHNSDYLADPDARSYTYDDNGEISYVRPPTDAYRIDRWPDLVGQGLAPRDLRVLVPPGTGPWPVLYMHDGQNLFDPEAFWGGWHVQDAVAARKADTGEDVLVVGIDNTGDRMTEYTQSDDTVEPYGDFVAQGAQYAALIHEDIEPWVASTYGTSGLDGIIGSSLGGLISLYVADQYPDDFDFAGSMSGTLGWGKFGQDNPVIEENYLAAGHRDFTIYADSGGDDGGDGCDDVDGDGFPEDDPNDADNYCVTRHFVDAMADSNGYTWDADLFHWHEDGATHDELHWKERFFRPLGIFLGIDD
jgi:hypothetical protein